MNTNSFPHRLRILRKKYGLTQQNLGHYLSMSPQAYSSYENGTHTPDLYVLKQLARLYNMTIDELLGLSSKNPLLPNADETFLDRNSLARLTQKEQKLLTLFSQLSAVEKEDFFDLVEVKVRLKRIREE